MKIDKLHTEDGFDLLHIWTKINELIESNNDQEERLDELEKFLNINKKQ